MSEVQILSSRPYFFCELEEVFFLISIQEVLKEVLWSLLQVMGPLLLCLLVVGIIVSLIQTLTQIQEPGLLFVSKFLVVVVFMLTFSQSSIRHLVELGEYVFDKIKTIKNYNPLT
jgi:flagellar biosynthetic protein FliQ